MVKWLQSVEDSFKFTYKLWRGITHAKGLVVEPDDRLTFMKNVREAENKAGALLIQLPPSVTISSFQQFERLIESAVYADDKRKWSLVVEFRHKSWYDDKTYALLQKYDATMVIHDKPNSVTLFMECESPFI